MTVLIEGKDVQPGSILSTLCNYVPLVFCLRLLNLINVAIIVAANLTVENGEDVRTQIYLSGCLICRKQYSAQSAIDLKLHIKGVHNLWNYLDYFVYLRERKHYTSTESRILKWVE